MALATTAAGLASAAPYIAGALELAKWTIDFAQRAQRGDMTEAEMAAEWEANVRPDVRNANALWERSKRQQGANPPAPD